jgi:hypothetical protein
MVPKNIDHQVSHTDGTFEADSVRLENGFFKSVSLFFKEGVTGAGPSVIQKGELQVEVFITSDKLGAASSSGNAQVLISDYLYSMHDPAWQGDAYCLDGYYLWITCINTNAVGTFVIGVRGWEFVFKP